MATNTEEYTINVRTVPASQSGPVWQGILDLGILLTGNPSKSYVEVIDSSDRRPQSLETGWYVRKVVETTWERLQAAIVHAAWRDEAADPMGCVCGPLREALGRKGRKGKTMMRVYYGDQSYDVEAETEQAAMDIVAAGLAQTDDRFQYPVEGDAMDELTVEVL